MPAMDFTSPRRYRYRKGSLFLGKSVFLRRPIGIKTERHAITIAGARSGKGACLIMPNLKRWPHNVLVIDPKGEAAEEAIAWRKKRGQECHVLDPFLSAQVPDKFRAQYNPLDDIDPQSMTAKEDVMAIADGIVMRSGSSSAVYWDDGGLRIIAGLIAYAKLRLPKEQQNLIEVRAILASRDRFAEVIGEMENITEMGNLCRSAMTSAFAKEGQYFISNARANTDWLDSEAMKNTLTKSTFSLNDLKSKKCSVFLVLPANYIGQHGRFLRMFVRASIEAMSRKTAKGKLKGRKCLFILDEFYSLGMISEISKAAGLMPGYGLQLWPILQDYGQLIELYDREGAATFYGNADAQIYFGNTDGLTLDEISRATDRRYKAGWFGADEEHVGQPNMSPLEVRAHVAKGNRDKVARRMIVFAKGGDILSLRLAPYFKD